MVNDSKSMCKPTLLSLTGIRAAHYHCSFSVGNTLSPFLQPHPLRFGVIVLLWAKLFPFVMLEVKALRASGLFNPLLSSFVLLHMTRLRVRLVEAWKCSEQRHCNFVLETGITLDDSTICSHTHNSLVVKSHTCLNWRSVDDSAGWGQGASLQ